MRYLSQPRHEGPARRRWRNRTTFRGLSLAEVWQWRVGRTVDVLPEDLPAVVQDAVLRHDMEWLADADALELPRAAVGSDRA